MKFKNTISTILVSGILLSSQSGFAMKRSYQPSSQTHVGLPSIDQLIMWAEVLRAAIQSLFSNPSNSMEIETTSQATSTGMTYISQAGQEFFFPHEQLAQLNLLAPGLRDMVSALSTHTLHLLQEIIRGNFDGLGRYISLLRNDEIKIIHENCQQIKAEQLQEFISNFLTCHPNDEPLPLELTQSFPSELWDLILSECGPVGRTKMRDVSHFFKEHVDATRKSGLTDTLPMETYITVGEIPMEPVVYGNRLYIANNDPDGTVSVISLDTNELLTTINVGDFPTQIFIFEDFLYVIDGNGHISIIDPTINEVVETIELNVDGFNPDECQFSIFSIDRSFYSLCGDGFISVIDPDENEFLEHIEVMRLSAHSGIFSPIILGGFLHVLRSDGYISVIDPKSNKVVDAIQVNKETLIGRELLKKIVALGKLLYAVSEDGRLFEIDPATKEIKTFETGAKPKHLFAFGSFILLQSGENRIIVFDPATGKILSPIDTSDPSLSWQLHLAVVKGQTLYIPTDGGTLAMIDLVTGRFLREFKVGESLIVPYVVGQFLVVRSGKFDKNVISVINPATSQVVKTIKFDTIYSRRTGDYSGNVYTVFAYGKSLYVTIGTEGRRGRIFKIDISGYL